MKYGIERLVPTDPEQLTDRIPLHYCEEWLDVNVSDTQVIISGKTSTCGPGYHAMLCELADILQNRHGILFEVEEDVPSNFFASRNFTALQRDFADWMGSLAAAMAQKANGENGLMLQLPPEQLLPQWQSDNVFTPQGPIALSYLREISTLNSDDRIAEAARWFPWWDKNPSGQDFTKIGEQIMWPLVAWHVPQNAEERRTMEAAKYCFFRASEMGTDVSKWSVETNELESMLAQHADERKKPNFIGTGYRRQICRWHLAQNWKAMLPGYMYEIFEGENHQLYFDDISIYITSFNIKSKSIDYDIPKAMEGNNVLASGVGNKFHWLLEQEPRADGQDFANTHLTAGNAAAMLLLTFTHKASMGDAFLVNIAQGITFVDS